MTRDLLILKMFSPYFFLFAAVFSCFSCAAQKPAVINAKNAGIDATDNNSDSKQIQQLINSAKRGDIIFFPKGIYLIDEPLEIKKGYLTLQGEEGSVFKFTNTTDWYDHYKTRVGMINICSNNVTIDHLYLDQGFARSGRTDGMKPLIGGIIMGCRYKGSAVSTKNITITHCTVYDYYGDAISVFNAFCENYTVKNNTLISSYIAGKWTDAGTKGEQAINAVSGKNILIDSNNIQGALDDAIAVHTDAENVTITNNKITTTGGRITVGGIRNGLIANNDITYIQDGGSAIDIAFEANGNTLKSNNNLTVTNNKIHVNPGVKIAAALRLMGPGTNVKITNNIFETSDRQGIGIMMRDAMHTKTQKWYFGDSVIVSNNSFLNFKYGVWQIISSKVPKPKNLEYTQNNFSVGKLYKEKGDE